MEPVALLVFFASLCGSLVIATTKNTDAPISTNLKVVAVADGKTFLADNTTPRNWTESRSYCEEMGMTFAEVTSRAQTDALKAAYSESDFQGNFWLSGRDAQEKRQFTWDFSGSPISENDTEMWIREDLPYQTCVYYYSYPSKSALHFWMCSYLMGTLCSV